MILCASSTQSIAAEIGLPGSIPASGGEYFAQRVELPVTDFAQDDPRWGQEYLGPTNETLAYQGCTVTSIVMVLNYYGIKSDPSLLNRFLTAHDGYDSEGFLDFSRVTAFAPRRIQLAYRGNPSYELLDRNLRLRHPVIVQLTLFDGGRHFVVVMGKKGFDYLVRDPAADPQDSIVPLKSLSRRINLEFLYLQGAN